jgi:hypothetical protein
LQEAEIIENEKVFSMEERNESYFEKRRSTSIRIRRFYQIKIRNGRRRSNAPLSPLLLIMKEPFQFLRIFALK